MKFVKSGRLTKLGIAVIVALAIVLATGGILLALWLAGLLFNDEQEQNEGKPFPSNISGNTFSIQWRNSTKLEMTLWLQPTQPLCTYKEASANIACDIKGYLDAGNGGTAAQASCNPKFGQLDPECTTNSCPGCFCTADGTCNSYNNSIDGISWEKNSELQKAMKASNVVMQKYDKQNKLISGNWEQNIPNFIIIQSGETVRLGVPYNDSKKINEWVNDLTDFDSSIGKGTRSWVTLNKLYPYENTASDIFVFEHNVFGSTPDTNSVNWDLSAVDGIHITSEAYFADENGTAIDCDKGSSLRFCNTNVQSVSKSSNGCPWSAEVFKDAAGQSRPTGTYSCKQPQNWADNSAVTKDGTVKAINFTSDYVPKYLPSANPVLTGLELATAASGTASDKKQYHVWYATNDQARLWLDWLQFNNYNPGDSDDIKCNSYGWQYDEQRYVVGQTPDPQTWDKLGNPGVNTTIDPDQMCRLTGNNYLNIEIKSVKVDIDNVSD